MEGLKSFETVGFHCDEELETEFSHNMGMLVYVIVHVFRGTNVSFGIRSKVS